MNVYAYVYIYIYTHYPVAGWPSKFRISNKMRIHDQHLNRKRTTRQFQFQHIHYPIITTTYNLVKSYYATTTNHNTL